MHFFEISEIIVYFLFSILAIGIIHGDRKRKIRVESEFKNRADDAIDNKLSDYYSSEIDAKKLADIKKELTTLIEGIGGSYNCPGFYIGHHEAYIHIESYLYLQRLKVIYK